jgi:hypothetical protein
MSRLFIWGCITWAVMLIILISSMVFYMIPHTQPIDYQTVIVVDKIVPITIIWLFLAGFTLFAVGISIKDRRDKTN